MNPIDLAVIVVYVAGCTALGAWLGSRSQGLKGYFLGESNIPAWAVMISIVATETSTATFLSVPGRGLSRATSRSFSSRSGIILGRIIVATVLLPSYFRGEIYTAYQVLQRPVRRSDPDDGLAPVPGRRGRSATASGSSWRPTVLEQITGWPIEAAILAVGLTTIVYTFLGGMKAVIWTDVIQFTIYIIGALVALAILAGKLPGGWTSSFETARPAQKFHMFDFSLRPDPAVTRSGPG